MENKKSFLSLELLILLLIQIPVNVFFKLLYGPNVIRPYTNMLYFLVLFVIGFFLAKKYGKLTPDIDLLKDKSNLKHVIWAIISMFLIYCLIKYRSFIFEMFPSLSFIEHREKGHWRFFSDPWLKINIFLSVSGIFLVVVAMELFYRAYIQELLMKYMSRNISLLCMSVLSGLHSIVLSPASGFVDFSLALIWGWVYLKSGLYGAILVHMVWDILFIYFPGN